MPNWELTDKRIYQLLKHPPQADKSTTGEFDSAYAEFVEDLFNYLNNENDYKQSIRKLNTTYVEFATLKAMETVSPTENNTLKLVYLDKIMIFLDREMNLVLHQIQFPKFFFSFDSDFESPFYLNPDVIQIIDIMEVAIGLFRIKDGIIRHDHKKVSLKDFLHIFGKMFNVEMKDIYGKEEDVIKRRPNKITGFLDRMKAVIIKRSKDEGYYRD